MMPLTCFKAYDIRGRLPDELNADIAYRIGRAYAEHLQPKAVIVGRDIRLSSDEMAAALSQGLVDAGVNVYDIGLCGTEEVYFATFAYQNQGVAMDGGIMVTASHNPKDYNGMKLVRELSKPISGDTGLHDIKALAERNAFAAPSATPGTITAIDISAAYTQHLLGYLGGQPLRPLKIVVNAGNGAAGHVIDWLEPALAPLEFIKIHHAPDGNFPNGIPNPLLPENRASTVAAIVGQQADLGIAWDGDFDRCFLFDETGRFIEGYYIVGLLAAAFLKLNPGAKIVHDPRLTWNTIDIVNSLAGTAIQSKTGHAFIKERMRSEDAVYGGEMSAHHYFRDFAYCDSGMIPWLLVVALMSQTGKSLSQLVDERMRLFPASGEINRTIADPAAILAKVGQHYQADALAVDFTDGLSMEFAQWRFNLRCSNTEPLVRLNVESRNDTPLMQAKTAELLALLSA
ncbi:phosphomannomutase [Methylovulum psychrotolerans]|uniref:phosphomannomutase n=1 Tax=Methylovulum psychrotolerans TaxID=1704499 RepID=UPI001BFF985A|nr:phosphomannomutase [Methylovulum psychrotolerans]MBT9098031.1 phosphomannomutase [Methylovulum psychrotolerans]